MNAEYFIGKKVRAHVIFNRHLELRYIARIGSKNVATERIPKSGFATEEQALADGVRFQKRCAKKAK